MSLEKWAEYGSLRRELTSPANIEFSYVGTAQRHSFLIRTRFLLDLMPSAQATPVVSAPIVNCHGIRISLR
jgi:hypothetical protein